METIFHTIRTMIGRSAPKKDITTFFSKTSKKEQKKIFKKVIRLANEEQQKVVKKTN